MKNEENQKKPGTYSLAYNKKLINNFVEENND
jgi:hypothetical protein